MRMRVYATKLTKKHLTLLIKHKTNEVKNLLQSNHNYQVVDLITDSVLLNIINSNIFIFNTLIKLG